MILTTTNSIENFKIVDYLGIVTGVALAEEKIVMGFSMSKYLNSIRNSVDATKEKAFQQFHNSTTPRLKSAEKDDSLTGYCNRIEMINSPRNSGQI